MRFKCCFLFSPLPGETILSNGLVQPPTNKKATEFKKEHHLIQTSIVGFEPFSFQDVTNISTTRPKMKWTSLGHDWFIPFFGRQRGRQKFPTLKTTNMAESSGILKLARHFEGITMQMWRQLSGIFPLIVHEIWVRNTFWPLIIASRKCQEHLGEAETVQDRCRKILAKLAAFHPFFFLGFFGTKTVEGDFVEVEEMSFR